MAPLRADRPVVLVTGSSGLLGSAYIRAVADQYAVAAFDRAGPPRPPAVADEIHVDLTSDDDVRKGIDHVRRTYGRRLKGVVHLAAYYDFSGAPSEKYDEVTVGGTRRLLRELADFEIGRFVFSSTMLVHAPCAPGQRIDEDWPLDPRWPYPTSKVHTETLLHEERGRTPVCILRVAGVYDDRCNSIPLAQMIRRIYEKRLTADVFPGDPGRGQSFVHLQDTVEALRLAVDQPALPEETTLLIGEPETLSYGDLHERLERLIHGEARRLRHIPKPLAKAGAWIQDLFGDPFIKPWMIDLADDHYALDISRARRELGWTPRRSLRETLPRMISALKADPVRWYHDHHLRLPRRMARALEAAG